MIGRMNTLPVTQRDIDAWAEFASFVQNELCRVGTALARRDNVSEQLATLRSRAAAAFVSMRASGANTPRNPLPPPVPLHLLDTPANRRLCRALWEAYEAAIEVDKERGTYMEGEPADGPTAMPIVELLCQVEEECNGPLGRGERA